MPAVAEHHVADDQQAPFIAEHFQGEIDRAAGTVGVVHMFPLPGVSFTGVAANQKK